MNAHVVQTWSLSIVDISFSNRETKCATLWRLSFRDWEVLFCGRCVQVVLTSILLLASSSLSSLLTPGALLKNNEVSQELIHIVTNFLLSLRACSHSITFNLVCELLFLLLTDLPSYLSTFLAPFPPSFLFPFSIDSYSSICP